MSEKPVATIRTEHTTCEVKCEFPNDRFWVRYGQRSDVQVRLEPSGDVYLCNTNYDKWKTTWAVVPFELFARELPEFIERLQVLAGEPIRGSVISAEDAG